MMHGREKSDSAIVAGKPTNKAGQPAAEPVEPRVEAKGNASQQSTRRTQSRVSVSHALERIRQSVRKKKKLRRQIPEVGAECPNWARSVLCGGRSVMSVPTAIRRERRADLSPQESLMPDFSPTGADARANSGEYSFLCTRQFESGVPSHTVGLCTLSRMLAQLTPR